MSHKKDMKNQKFGHLTVLELSTHHNKKGQTFWICQCDCGRKLIVRGDRLRLGRAKQCTVCFGRGRSSKFIQENTEDDGHTKI